MADAELITERTIIIVTITTITMASVIAMASAITMGLVIIVIMVSVITTTITLDGICDRGGIDMLVDGHLSLCCFKGGDLRMSLLLSLPSQPVPERLSMWHSL